MISMAHKHSTTPVTPQQKVMSKRHLAHRAAVEKMPEKNIGQKIEKVKVAIRYDQNHGDEHKKSGKTQRKVLKKLLKMKVKESK